MFLKLIAGWLFPDKRSQREKDQEREFIEAVNSLKTLSVNEHGGMSIDPEEVRDVVIAARENYRHLLNTPHRENSTPPEVEKDNISALQQSHTHNHSDSYDFIQQFTWRRLPSGSSVQYVCLQSLTTGKYAVACAHLFSGDFENLPPWLSVNVGKYVASVLKDSNLQWHGSIKDAIDAWDSDL
ncbi:hypothetical protein C4Q27_03005 [Pseudomonas sp. SWI36]|nr:hypothetical protein C4Q27_03005 [Pseudomonas sp. SWI36]